MSDWYKNDVSFVTTHFKSDGRLGLNESEARVRQAHYGFNEFLEKRGRSPVKILSMQFTSTVVLSVIISAILSAALAVVDVPFLQSFFWNRGFEVSRIEFMSCVGNIGFWVGGNRQMGPPSKKPRGAI